MDDNKMYDERLSRQELRLDAEEKRALPPITPTPRAKSFVDDRQIRINQNIQIEARGNGKCDTSLAETNVGRADGACADNRATKPLQGCTSPRRKKKVEQNKKTRAGDLAGPPVKHERVRPAAMGPSFQPGLVGGPKVAPRNHHGLMRAGQNNLRRNAHNEEPQYRVDDSHGYRVPIMEANFYTQKQKWNRHLAPIPPIRKTKEPENRNRLERTCFPIESYTPQTGGKKRAQKERVVENVVKENICQTNEVAAHIKETTKSDRLATKVKRRENSKSESSDSCAQAEPQGRPEKPDRDTCVRVMRGVNTPIDENPRNDPIRELVDLIVSHVSLETPPRTANNSPISEGDTSQTGIARVISTPAQTELQLIDKEKDEPNPLIEKECFVFDDATERDECFLPNSGGDSRVCTPFLDGQSSEECIDNESKSPLEATESEKMDSLPPIRPGATTRLLRKGRSMATMTPSEEEWMSFKKSRDNLKTPRMDEEKTPEQHIPSPTPSPFGKNRRDNSDTQGMEDKNTLGQKLSSHSLSPYIRISRGNSNTSGLEAEKTPEQSLSSHTLLPSVKNCRDCSRTPGMENEETIGQNVASHTLSPSVKNNKDNTYSNTPGLEDEKTHEQSFPSHTPSPSVNNYRDNPNTPRKEGNKTSEQNLRSHTPSPPVETRRDNLNTLGLEDEKTLAQNLLTQIPSPSVKNRRENSNTPGLEHEKMTDQKLSSQTPLPSVKNRKENSKTPEMEDEKTPEKKLSSQTILPSVKNRRDLSNTPGLKDEKTPEQKMSSHTLSSSVKNRRENSTTTGMKEVKTPEQLPPSHTPSPSLRNGRDRSNTPGMEEQDTPAKNVPTQTPSVENGKDNSNTPGIEDMKTPEQNRPSQTPSPSVKNRKDNSNTRCIEDVKTPEQNRPSQTPSPSVKNRKDNSNTPGIEDMKTPEQNLPSQTPSPSVKNRKDNSNNRGTEDVKAPEQNRPSHTSPSPSVKNHRENSNTTGMVNVDTPEQNISLHTPSPDTVGLRDERSQASDAVLLAQPDDEPDSLLPFRNRNLATVGTVGEVSGGDNPTAVLSESRVSINTIGYGDQLTEMPSTTTPVPTLPDAEEVVQGNNHFENSAAGSHGPGTLPEDRHQEAAPRDDEPLSSVQGLIDWLLAKHLSGQPIPTTTTYARLQELVSMSTRNPLFNLTDKQIADRPENHLPFNINHSGSQPQENQSLQAERGHVANKEKPTVDINNLPEPALSLNTTDMRLRDAFHAMDDAVNAAKMIIRYLGITDSRLRAALHRAGRSNDDGVNYCPAAERVAQEASAFATRTQSVFMTYYRLAEAEDTFRDFVLQEFPGTDTERRQLSRWWTNINSQPTIQEAPDEDTDNERDNEHDEPESEP